MAVCNIIIIIVLIEKKSGRVNINFNIRDAKRYYLQ